MSSLPFADGERSPKETLKMTTCWDYKGLRAPKLDQVNPEIFDGDPEDEKRGDTEAPRHLVRRLDNVTSPRRCPDRSGKLCGKPVSCLRSSVSEIHPILSGFIISDNWAPCRPHAVLGRTTGVDAGTVFDS